MLSRLASIMLLFAAGLAATPLFFVANLDGPSESPSNASPGTGFTFVTIDTTAHTLQVQVTFQGLLAGNTAAHIHVINGPGDANTADTLGPVATTTPTFPGFPTGATAGTYNNTLFTDQASSYNPAFVTAAGSLAVAEAALFAGIIEGRAYLNIHSTTFPGGEIRGFLVATPEPATYAMAIAGLGMLWILKRKRTAQ
jgi:hypothetical protein